jgi:hypothetical protein
MSNQVASTSTSNIVPVQAEFAADGSCLGLVGPGGAYFSPPIAATTVYASEALGYYDGAFGEVTQATSKSTGVTLNSPSGRIIMNNAALNNNAVVTFKLTNNILSANDVLIINISGGATAGGYFTFVTAMADGSCDISLVNRSGGSLSEAVQLNFAVIHVVDPA